MVKHNTIIAVLFLLLVSGSNSVFGGAKSLGSSSPAVLSPEANLEDSLVGVWEVTNVDVSAIKEQISKAQLQVDKDGLARKIKTVSNNLMGSKMTVNADRTFQTANGNNNVSGTWKVNNRILITHSLSSETKDGALLIVSLSGTTLVAKKYFGDSLVVITYARK